MFPLSRSWISTETQISWLENQDQLDYVTTGARSWHWNYRVKKKIDFYLWNLVDWFHNFGHNTSLSLIQSLSLAIPIPLQQTMNSSFITGGDHILPTCSGNKTLPFCWIKRKSCPTISSWLNSNVLTPIEQWNYSSWIISPCSCWWNPTSISEPHHFCFMDTKRFSPWKRLNTKNNI